MPFWFFTPCFFQKFANFVRMGAYSFQLSASMDTLSLTISSNKLIQEYSKWDNWIPSRCYKASIYFCKKKKKTINKKPPLYSAHKYINLSQCVNSVRIGHTGHVRLILSITCKIYLWYIYMAKHSVHGFRHWKQEFCY